MIASIIALIIIFLAVVAADVVLAKQIKGLKNDREAVAAERKRLIEERNKINADLCVRTAFPEYEGNLVPLKATYELNMFDADRMSEKMDLEAEVKKCLVDMLKNGLDPYVTIFKTTDLPYCKYRWQAQVKVIAPKGIKTEFGTFSRE